MRIKYDPAADAVYVQLSEGTTHSVGQAGVSDRGVIIDTDSAGRPRGFEFLSVSSKGIPVDDLPEEAARAVEAFIASGALRTNEVVEREYLL